MIAQTVLGPIPASELGLTLMHEHLLFDFSMCRSEPRTDLERTMAARPLERATLGALRFNPCVVPDNLEHRDVDLAVAEVAAFVEVGGRTLVDPTNASIGRDPTGLQAIARRSGLHIVMGSGYYYQVALDAAFARRGIDDIADEIVRDLTVGVGDSGVRAGLIGEIGTSSPITESEERSLRAAARAQARTGAPLMVHLDGWKREGGRVLDLIAAEGGDPHRTILCHLNPAWFDLDYQLALLERGAYLEFDMFGIDHFYPPDRASPGELPAIGAVARLIDLGHIDRLLLSQDIYLKMMLQSYGGYGYAHLLTNLLPYLDDAGIGAGERERMMVGNGGRVLGWGRG
jgi:phosphotriesterase-related protein